VEALLAFATALLAFRLAGRLAGRWRDRRAPELALWSGSLLAYALAAGALAWSAAAGWSGPSFRVYYLFGGLLTAALLGAGSLVLAGRRWAQPLALLYTGLAAGVAIAVPLTEPVSGTAIPDAADHLDVFPARVLALVGNGLGTLAVVVVAVLTFRRRPLGNVLIVAGVAVAGAGSALFGLGEASTAASLAVAALLLYAGFVVRPGGLRLGVPGPSPDRDRADDEQHERGDLDDEARRPPVGRKHAESLKRT
jgi:hypothetical protein